MIEITDNHYRAVAKRLLETIGKADFFNGTVVVNGADYQAQLRATLLIYHTPRRDPADLSHATTDITDIVPVWWEHHMQTADGEVLNDFCWLEFKKYLRI